MKIRLIAIILLILSTAVFQNCKTVHKTKTRIEGARVSRNAILDTLRQPDLKYNWFFAKAKIEIDGGVDLKNAPLLIKAGADVLVAGNTVFGSADPVKTIEQLKNS